MQIFADETSKGDVVLVLTKSEGQDLIRALEFATAPRKILADMKPLSKSNRAHKIAAQIEQKLPVY